ncbi:hypothetical protein AYL99_01785 [Fonsecaea erecta]|uniref:Uncharacterized protein n=1 Tax=Fonsecaea erecta TaxID=1367422 RepID=A0A178ZRU8_9EURO|nr:hypothetical protein AYL99_01785 [Fonsecaea erecta]OAP62558.1 hypothetical protein AYL99_01785 [Fonsecaea erecta]
MHRSPGADKQIFGTFQVNVFGDTVDDPWARGYLTRRQNKRIERIFPLHDFRDEVFGNPQGDGWSWSRSAELLKRHGFTAVKFDTSKFVPADANQATSCDFDDVEVLEDIYFPQVKQALVKLTGAKEIFITNSIVRRGETGASIDGCTKTTGDRSNFQHVQDTAVTNGENKTEEANYKALHDNKPTHLKSSDNARPSRVPHMDYTPLGARCAIRSWRPDIYHAAVKSGVIPTEDAICASAQVDPQTHDSDAVINSEYNYGGKLGPRYAAYSVWRPLHTVTRDPLAMAPRCTFNGNQELTFAPRYLKVLAAPSMKGDFLRELEALFITEENAMKAANENANTDRATPGANGEVEQLPSSSLASSDPQWYYLAEQKPNEVIVLKFFDSAALVDDGQHSEEASSVPHASPDIGKASYGSARESIEVRCIAFW